MSYGVNAIFREIEKDEAKYIKFWEDICNIETLSKDKEALDGLVVVRIPHILNLRVCQVSVQ